MTDRVSVSIAGGIADVRLNRPDKLNALDPAMLDAIAATLKRLASEPGLRCVVLSGEGRGFCAGLDLASMAALDRPRDIIERSHGSANLFQHVAFGWRELAVPVIASVHGMALGGGLQIMSGADIRIATPDARLSIMEIKWGIVPDMGGIALWRGLVRDDHLRELAMTAREFSGEQARALGFVTHLDTEPLTCAMEMAREIASRNPDALRAIKRLINASHDKSGDVILLNESHEQQQIIGTPNQLEAVAAALQKRAPQFED